MTLADKHEEYVHAVISGGALGGLIAPDSRVARSWIRCAREYGLVPAGEHEIEVVAQSDLRARQQSRSQLLATAQVEMSNLYQQLTDSGFAVLLTDADGVVLDCIGDLDFAHNEYKSGFTAGAVWTEKQQGTNGMGTCLYERRPLVVHQRDHFLVKNIGITCSAAPIFDPQGELVAVLDASSDSQRAQQHTLVLVNMSAQTIENRIFLCRFKDNFVIRFHSRPEFVGTLGEGEIAVAEDGTVMAVNRSALFQLGLHERSELIGKGISEVFSLSLGALIDQSARSWTTPLPIFEARRGNRFFAVTQQPENMVIANTAGSLRRPKSVVACTPRSSATLRLDDMALGDPRMDEAIHRAKRTLDSEIPVLLVGETGTGKELFAKAIHSSGEEAHKPFVAVNCAALPEALIESELFGYKSGAFTGANREGRRGKILQADGGTLFLDEIGDMPLQLQARLLRVLEEREVSPLGGETAVKVEFRLISATHRNLQDLIAAGEFREDLYYRLLGVTLTLPALRDRKDKHTLIRKILALEARSQDLPTIEDDALLLLETYEWPGNIRQLRNVLRAALALHDGSTIRVRDLPEEIVRTVPPATRATPAESAPSCPAELNSLKSAEREALLQGLERHHWKITNLAGELKISRNTLYRKMRQLGIKDPRR